MDRPEPPTVPVWLSSYLMDHAVQLVAKREPTLVWYETQAVGVALGQRGLPVYGQGTTVPEDPPGRTCAVSWHVHRDGRNLQHAWSRNLVVEPPASGAVWEQLLGRTHRAGQEADEVVCDVYAHAGPFTDAFRQACYKARYIEDTTGNVQKLNFASLVDWKGDE